MKKYFNNKNIIIISSILIIVIIGTFFCAKKDVNEIKKISFINKSVLESNIPKSKYDDTIYYVNRLPEYRRIYNNNDIVGRLIIKSVGLDTLITRSSDNEYYLNYSIDRKYDTIGVPFVDFRNVDLSHAKQINIYGHNTKNSSIYDKVPFTKINKFLDNNFVKDNRSIILDTDYGRFKYEIISIKVSTDQTGDHMNLEYMSDDDWLRHVKILRDGARYDSGDIMEKEDNLLILQSCQYNPPDSFLIITCKKVN